MFYERNQSEFKPQRRKVTTQRMAKGGQARANLTGYGKRCFPPSESVERCQNHNKAMDAARLGLAIRDCKKRGFYPLAYAPFCLQS